MLRLSSLCLLAASGLLGLAVAVSGFDAWSQQAAHAANLQRKSVADLAQAARQGNAAEAAEHGGPGGSSRPKTSRAFLTSLVRV